LIHNFVRHSFKHIGVAGSINPMSKRNEIKSWLTDMDGVLVHEGHALPGAAELIKQWQDSETPFLVLTNNSIYTPRDLSARLRAIGLDVPEERIWTSALATANFLKSQKPDGTAFVLGEAGMTTALHDIGYVMTDQNPDYVVLGETRNFNFDSLTRAIRLINNGARFIATNPDATGPSAEGVLPATGSVAALITKATGKEPYIVGKPNPMMFRSAMRKIGAHSESTGMIGDRMDTDVVAGIEAGLHTVLVLTGIADQAEIEKYPFRPNEILNSVADLVEQF
jgi:NagD protein